MEIDVRTRVPVAAVFLLLMLLAASCGGGIQTDVAAGEPTTAPPIDYGVWRELPEAPIGTRLYTVSGWSGEEAVFWAGSNLQRDFAYARGAAYDPASDSWRELAVPGWGHPGLTGTVFDGQLFVAAKGGGSRIDLSDGSETGLPDGQGFVLSTLIATDDAVWGLGSVSWFEEGGVRVGIARYEPEEGAWIPGPVFEGTPEMDSLFQDRLFVEQPVLWTGSEIIVWSQDGQGLSFDPKAESWRVLPPLVAPQGTLTDSAVAVAGARLVALVEFEDNGTAGYGVASWDGETWTWRDTDIAVTDFETVTIAGVRDWIMVFSPDQPPYTVHVPTGDSMRHDNAPIAGVQVPNVVWTGDELVIWGGAPTRTDDSPSPPGGAVWIPPSTSPR